MKGKTKHACALEISQTGILIRGNSGSGKTSLMMGLLERAKRENLQAYLVCDDQVYLIPNSEGLDAIAPKEIAGAVEVRGYGIINLPNKDKTQVDLVVDLVEDEIVERMPDQKFCELENLRLPLVEVPERHENQAVRIVYAWLVENAGLQLAGKSSKVNQNHR